MKVDFTPFHIRPKNLIYHLLGSQENIRSMEVQGLQQTQEKAYAKLTYSNYKYDGNQSMKTTIKTHDPQRRLHCRYDPLLKIYKRKINTRSRDTNSFKQLYTFNTCICSCSQRPGPLCSYLYNIRIVNQIYPFYIKSSVYVFLHISSYTHKYTIYKTKNPFLFKRHQQTQENIFFHLTSSNQFNCLI